MTRPLFIFMDWKSISTHNDKIIKGFFGDYRFLSNFHICDVWFEGLCYPSSEHAYMAAKAPPEEREPFSNRSLKSSEAKKLGQLVALLPDWHLTKYNVMLRVVFEKFASNPELRNKLLMTGDRYLEETNNWGDRYWGVDFATGKGDNNLGNILVKVREALKV